MLYLQISKKSLPKKTSGTLNWYIINLKEVENFLSRIMGNSLKLYWLIL